MRRTERVNRAQYLTDGVVFVAGAATEAVGGLRDPLRGRVAFELAALALGVGALHPEFAFIKSLCKLMTALIGDGGLHDLSADHPPASLIVLPVVSVGAALVGIRHAHGPCAAGAALLRGGGDVASDAEEGDGVHGGNQSR